MNSLNELNMNASVSLGQLIIFSSKARKQLLQAFDPENRHIAQTLRPILEEWEEISKEQRAQLYESIKAMCDAAEKNEAQAQKEIDQEEAQAKEEARALEKAHAQEKARFASTSASSASSISSASPARDTRELAQLSARKPTVSPSRSPSRSPASSSASSSLRSSSARDLQRFFTQIAPLSPASSVPTSASISPASSARDARNLHRKPMQRPSVSPPRSPPRTFSSHDSPRSSPRYSPARDSRRTPTRNTPVSPSRSSARTPPHGSPHDSPRSSPRYSPARDSRRAPTRNTPVSPARSPARTPPRDSSIPSPRGSPARTPPSGSSRSLSSHDFPRDSSIKPCLSVEDLYVMFHRLSEEGHASQGQRQRVFLGPTYRFSAETSVSPPIKAPSSRSLKAISSKVKGKTIFLNPIGLANQNFTGPGLSNAKIMCSNPSIARFYFHLWYIRNKEENGSVRKIRK